MNRSIGATYVCRRIGRKEGLSVIYRRPQQCSGGYWKRQQPDVPVRTRGRHAARASRHENKVSALRVGEATIAGPTLACRVRRGPGSDLCATIICAAVAARQRGGRPAIWIGARRCAAWPRGASSVPSDRTVPRHARAAGPGGSLFQGRKGATCSGRSADRTCWPCSSHCRATRRWHRTGGMSDKPSG